MLERKGIQKRLILFAVCLALCLAASSGHAASTKLPNGAELTVTIDDPVHCTEFRVPAGEKDIDVPINGTASVGQGVPDIGLIVVVDVSGSTEFYQCDDTRNILQCEKAGVANLLNSAEINSVAEVGIVVYGEGAEAADMTADDDDDPKTLSIVEAKVVNDSIMGGGVNLYTLKIVGTGSTDYSAALADAALVANAMGSGTKIVVFLSDGFSNQEEYPGAFDDNLAALQGEVGTIFPFAIGENSDCTGGDYGDLADMGDCQKIDPADLEGILPDLLSTMLDTVTATIGGTPLTLNVNPPVPAAGPVAVNYDATAADLVPDDHKICATAEGSDTTGSASVEECGTIHLLQLTASPLGAKNDLNKVTEHRVSGGIVGGTGPARDINFTVTGQNAATAEPPNMAISVPPNERAVFTYKVPQTCKSLGQDIIEVSTTIAGEIDTIKLEKWWIDTVPPKVTCDPSVNPNGKTPQAPGQGQNEDGFYQINAHDPNLNCPVTLVLKDGAGYTFPGPFKPGDIIKYTQDNSVPQVQKKMGSVQGNAGAVLYHLIGHGDLMATATDTSGNSSHATCLVPQPPK